YRSQAPLLEQKHIAAGFVSFHFSYAHPSKKQKVCWGDSSYGLYLYVFISIQFFSYVFRLRSLYSYYYIIQDYFKISITIQHHS
ncbi:MAG TPA: hypothetical protein VFI70_04130, partial [Nitrososphaeraceae archaeon]|nr:hypothetical protein [Nitrososphaeraceae archaeon]